MQTRHVEVSSEGSVRVGDEEAMNRLTTSGGWETILTSDLGDDKRLPRER